MPSNIFLSLSNEHTFVTNLSSSCSISHIATALFYHSFDLLFHPMNRQLQSVILSFGQQVMMYSNEMVHPLNP
jgi:hypothetical protein